MFMVKGEDQVRASFNRARLMAPPSRVAKKAVRQESHIFGWARHCSNVTAPRPGTDLTKLSVVAGVGVFTQDLPRGWTLHRD